LPQSQAKKEQQQHHLYAIKALKNLSCEPSVAPHMQSSGANKLLASLENDLPDLMAHLEQSLAALAV